MHCFLQNDSVSAYSNGAGGCIGGQAAVGGYHLDNSNNRPVINGTLDLGMVYVSVKTYRLASGLSSPYSLSTQTDYTLTVTSDNTRGSMKGILMRLQGQDANNVIIDLTGAIQPVDNAILKEASVCQAPIVGVTHTDSAVKTTVSAMLHFDNPGTIILDVTIVGLNDATASVFGYSNYAFQVTGKPAIKTLKPTLPPGVTAPPTASPTLSDITGTLSPTYSAYSGAPTKWNDGLGRMLLVCLGIFMSTML